MKVTIYSDFYNFTDEQLLIVDELREDLKNIGFDDERFLGKIYLSKLLKSRKFNKKDAYNQLVLVLKNILYQNTCKIHRLFIHADSKEVLLKVKQLYRIGFHGETTNGVPVWIEQTGRLDVPSLFKIVDLAFMTSQQVWEQTRCRQWIYPRLAEKQRTDFHQNVVIIDMDGFTFSKFDSKVREVLAGVTKLGNNFFPEQMHKTFLINVPMVFNMAWKAISQFIDEGTRAKIEFLGSRQSETLLKQIDADKLPKCYGGNTDLFDAEGNFQEQGQWTNQEQTTARNIDKFNCIQAEDRTQDLANLHRLECNYPEIAKVEIGLHNWDLEIKDKDEGIDIVHDEHEINENNLIKQNTDSN